MAKRVTDNDIQMFNELYYKYKTYAEVARQTGFSATTVKKYIISHWRPTESLKIKHLSESDIPPISIDCFKNLDNWGTLCELSESEIEEIKLLWEELSI